MNKHTGQLFEGEYRDITPEKILLRLYNKIIQNGVQHIRIQQFAKKIGKLLEIRGTHISPEDINTLRVQNLSLITLLLEYGYNSEARELLKIEGIENNEIDIFIGKLLFVFGTKNNLISLYINTILETQNINVIPDIGVFPGGSIFHFLTMTYTSNSEYKRYDIIGLIDDLINIPGFDINALNTEGYTVLDVLYYEPRDTTGDIEKLEELILESGGKHNTINSNSIGKNVDYYKNMIKTTLDCTISTKI